MLAHFQTNCVSVAVSVYIQQFLVVTQEVASAAFASMCVRTGVWVKMWKSNSP